MTEGIRSRDEEKEEQALEKEPFIDPEDIPYVSRNFWAWVGYQFFFRIGWQFKMEATMMAGLISYLAPAPAVMGLFTTLNAFGRNLSPLGASPLVDRFRFKRSILLIFWMLATLCWLALTIYLWMPRAGDKSEAIWIFGICYLFFFVFLGGGSVAQGALLGKVIPAGIRGRAMAMGMGLSGVINVFAILFTYGLISHGHYPEPRSYALAFTFTVVFFACAAISLLFISERQSETRKSDFNPLASIGHFTNLARGNRNLRKLMVVNMAVATGGSMLQFYTGFWRSAGTMTVQALMIATIFQVFWQSLSSSFMGRIADKIGNRHVICRLLWIEAIVPVTAVVLGGLHPFKDHWYWFLGVYTLIGVRFPVYQLMVNYLLEITPQREHAMAMGAVTIVQLLAAPAPLLLGILAGFVGYEITFILASAILIFACIVALGMQEVRVVHKEG